MGPHREREVDGGFTRAERDTPVIVRACAGGAVAAPGASSMEGVVLAGVHAWGECVLESVTCRPLFPVAGAPLISHTLAWLRDGGITRASVCANSDTGALRRCLGSGDRLSLNIHYYEDKMPRGPAGCARDAVVDSAADIFIVVEGTVVPNLDLADLASAHRASGAVLTVVVAEGDGERPTVRPDRFEPIGVYVFSRAVLAHVPANGYQDIKESLIPRLYAQGQRVGTYVAGRGGSPRVTNAASYMGVSKWMVERLVASGSVPDGYVRLNDALVHESARLHAQARFVGPVLIGPHCRIDEGAMIIGPTCVGSHVQIGARSVVSRSVLWDNCQVGAEAVLDHCILTDSATADGQVVYRETICMARPARLGWLDRLGTLLRKDRGAKRGITYVPSLGPAAVTARPLPALTAARSDARRTDSAQRAIGARTPDR